MKKALMTIILAVFAFTQTQAQITFKPGIRAGVNFSHFTQGDYYNAYDSNYSPAYRNDFNSKTDFYAGFYGALHLTKYYTLQPEIDYSRQGSAIVNNGIKSQFDVSYLSIAVANKFTFDKFNIHLGPTIDFVVEKNYSVNSDVDFAFFLGAGYNFTPNFGIEGRVKKGIIPVIDNNNFDNSHTNVVFSLGATYTFDVN